MKTITSMSTAVKLFGDCRADGGPGARLAGDAWQADALKLSTRPSVSFGPTEARGEFAAGPDG
jgi:hypothetical protein